ncbi:hypothetical protein HK099_003065, partial [Clydaea vesicula]
MAPQVESYNNLMFTPVNNILFNKTCSKFYPNDTSAKTSTKSFKKPLPSISQFPQSSSTYIPCSTIPPQVIRTNKSSLNHKD